MGVANTFITDWDAKFTYNFWRPITAIRNGDQDGNDATERDAGWTPLNATPMHPEYPSQAAIMAGVAVGIVDTVFGPNPTIPFTVTDFMDAKLKREFRTLKQMADEHNDVRVWGGIHFRTRWKSATTWAGRSPSISSRTRSSRPIEELAKASLDRFNMSRGIPSNET